MGGSAQLRIVLLGGFVPNVGASFPVMTWGSHVGEFENYLGTASIGNDRAFVMNYTAGGLTLTVAATPTTGDAPSSAQQWRALRHALAEFDITVYRVGPTTTLAKALAS